MNLRGCVWENLHQIIMKTILQEKRDNSLQHSNLVHKFIPMLQAKQKQQWKRQKSHSKIDVMKDIDSVPSNVQSARQEALMYVFEDNEAVIKMIIKGRSPTMRHVSRTHRVALDWLFDRINLDPKIQIKYIDTKNQIADILTKGNFTRDEWNCLLCLFNISHFSSTVCSEKMAKRLQERFRRRTCHSKIATNDESYCKGAVARIILDFSKPGEEKLWKSRTLQFNCSERGAIGAT